jgi:hypothetical protein
MILPTSFWQKVEMMAPQVSEAAQMVVDRPVDVNLGDEPWHP